MPYIQLYSCMQACTPGYMHPQHAHISMPAYYMHITWVVYGSSRSFIGGEVEPTVRTRYRPNDTYSFRYLVDRPLTNVGLWRSVGLRSALPPLPSTRSSVLCSRKPGFSNDRLWSTTPFYSDQRLSGSVQRPIAKPRWLSQSSQLPENSTDDSRRYMGLRRSVSLRWEPGTNSKTLTMERTLSVVNVFLRFSCRWMEI